MATLGNLAAQINPLRDATNQQGYTQQPESTPLRTALQREDDRRRHGGAITKRKLVQPIAKAAVVSALLHPHPPRAKDPSAIQGLSLIHI